MSKFPAVFNLANLNGNNGFAINGINGNDKSGFSVSGAGDINGDDIADIIIGAPGDMRPGQSYVIFGSKSGFTTPFNLTDLNGNNGFVINGINGGDYSGYSVSRAGDVNNDGVADIIIGAPVAPDENSMTGQSYVIFGSKSGFTTPFNLTDLNGNNGFAINCVNYYSASGTSVSGAGDVNNDGVSDIIIGAPNGGLAGQSYVIFGNKSGFTTPFNLTNLNGNNGFVINGNTIVMSGESVSGAGDVNGDGISDIIIGAPNATGTQRVGESYVVFGSKSGFTSSFDLADLNGNNGFTIIGVDNGSLLGSSVSGAGDVNGDGIADIIIGAPWANNNLGQSYVIFGSKSGFTTPFDLSNLNGNNGFVVNGIEISDISSVSGAGDVNGDGIADIIIGALDVNNAAGQSYVIFGSKSGFTTPLNLTDLNGNNGFIINGINSDDWSGASVSGAGDVNGDGIADIIIGAPDANWNVGQSYVVFGSKSGFTELFNPTDLGGVNNSDADESGWL